MALGRRRIRRDVLILAAAAMLVSSAGKPGVSGTGRDDVEVTDIDGNHYRAVRIGRQVWLAENLRTTRFRDGTAVRLVGDKEDWSDFTVGAYSKPARDSLGDRASYGLLYNFYAVSDSCRLCPEGWHVPSAEEWRGLVDGLGGVDVAGGAMKDTTPGFWRVLVPGTSNESGFSAVPAGGRGRFGRAGEVGYYATWWSSTSHDSAYAWHWGLYPDRNGIRSNPGHKASGFSVRCIEDSR
jgi:uncharacterized protein (TIGR02145 family)